MPFYLGIDGGGTKTECVIGDATRLLGRSSVATIKIRKIAKADARRHLQEGIQRACTRAGVTIKDISSSCIGISGAGIAEVHEWTLDSMRKIVGGEVIVVGDSVVAHRAAFGAGPGALVIAGTGSVCFGRNEHREEARSGGWGPAVSDEGSGYWIGRLAVAEVLRAADAGRSTALQQGIMGAWKLKDREQLVSMANLNPPPDFSALLPVVVECAKAGDNLAVELLSRAGTELATLAKIVIRKLWPSINKRVPVAVAGGVFAHSEMVQQIFANSLRAERRNIALNTTPVEPVLGALDLARAGS